MADSVGIGDEDTVDVVRDIEAAFDIRIADAEAEACRTLGDISDLLARKFRDSGVGGQACASAMAFYRLRRAVADLAPDGRPRPSTPLTAFKTMSPNRFLTRIHARTGLKLPAKRYSWAGWLGSAGLIAGVLGLLPVGSFAGWRWALIPAASILVSRLLLSLDPGKFPDGVNTLGELSTKLSRLNFGHLAKAGARVTERELWICLTEVIAPYTRLPPAEMRAESPLFQR